MEKEMYMSAKTEPVQEPGQSSPGPWSRLKDRLGLHTKREVLEFSVNLLFLLCGFTAVACVLLICIYLIAAGLPAIAEIGLKDFLFGTTWAGRQGQFGILPFILTSVAGTAGAVLIGVPVGILTAMFLAKVAPPKVSAVIHSAVERPFFRRLPVGRHCGAGHYDSAVYRECGRDFPAGGAERI